MGLTLRASNASRSASSVSGISEVVHALSALEVTSLATRAAVRPAGPPLKITTPKESSSVLPSVSTKADVQVFRKLASSSSPSPKKNAVEDKLSKPQTTGTSAKSSVRIAKPVQLVKSTAMIAPTQTEADAQHSTSAATRRGSVSGSSDESSQESSDDSSDETCSEVDASETDSEV